MPSHPLLLILTWPWLPYVGHVNILIYGFEDSNWKPAQLSPKAMETRQIQNLALLHRLLLLSKPSKFAQVRYTWPLHEQLSTQKEGGVKPSSYFAEQDLGQVAVCPPPQRGSHLLTG